MFHTMKYKTGYVQYSGITDTFHFNIPCEYISKEYKTLRGCKAALTRYTTRELNK